MCLEQRYKGGVGIPTWRLFLDITLKKRIRAVVSINPFYFFRRTEYVQKGKGETKFSLADRKLSSRMRGNFSRLNFLPLLDLVSEVEEGGGPKAHDIGMNQRRGMKPTGLIKRPMID